MKSLLIITLFFFFTLVSHAQDIELNLVASGFNSPVNIQNAGDDRLFIVGQGGLIKILNVDGTVNQTPFLDLSSEVSSGNERGLLGLAFGADYNTEGYFYVNYTDLDGNTVISRFQANGFNPDLAIPDSETIILTIDQPASNHNGGCIAFGPDGKLYIAVGDGGGAGDPNDNAQNLNSLLGKILRLDVTLPSPYVPSDNPFVGMENIKSEIWDYGVRNPWKFSFDSETGNLWIADVGQNEFEEINRLDNSGGQNLGWRCFEGNEVYDQSGNCPDDSEVTFPLAQYSHNNSGQFKCSVTGGYVYRGAEYTNFQGLYFFADYCSDEIGTVDANGNIIYYGPFPGNNFTTFGVDNNNNLYVAGIQSGKIYKIEDASLSVEAKNSVSVSLYPNPTKDVLNFESKTTLTKAVLYSVEGKKLQEFTLTIKKGKISLEKFPSGIYFLKVFDKASQNAVKSILKN